MDPLSTDPIWQQIQQTGRLDGRRVHWFESAESTNSLALAMGKEGALTGTVLVADTQTKGRGRLGKRWNSLAGTGLYCTILLRPTIPLGHLSRITLAAGLAAARAIDEVSGVVSAIKWPNDVLIHGRKVAGILAECEMAGGEWPLVALGIGINLSTNLEQFPQDLRPRATSLLVASGKVIGKGVMLAALLGRIEQTVARLEQGDFAGIINEWRTKDATANKWLTWLATNGQAVHGLSLGPDHEGQLVIRDSAGESHHVMSGDITLDPNTLNDYFP
jgi:BirA family biotin operon repressor/biotin-[acetyl-CoA-carboxylase] ligase